MSSRLKILLLFLVTFVLGTGYVFLYWLPKAENDSLASLMRMTQREMVSISETLISPILQNRFALVHENLSALLAEHPNWVSLQLNDRDGERLFPIAEPKGIIKESQLRLQHEINIRNSHMGTLYLVVDFTEELEVLRVQSLELVSTLFLGVLIILLTLVLLLDKLVVQPVHSLSEAAKRLAKGNFDTQLPSARNDEVGTLIDSFEKMSSAIKLTNQHLEQVVAERTQALMISEARFRDFAEVGSDWLWELDAKLCFTYLSDSFEPNFEWASSRSLGRKKADIYRPIIDSGTPEEQQSWQQHFENLKAHRPFQDFIQRWITDASETIYVSNSGKPIFDESGNFTGYRGVARNVTRQIVADEDLRNALVEAERANQAKTEFLATMSHELRTPLNAIIGFSHTMAGQYFGALGSDKYVEYAHDIESSGEHLLQLINDLLDLSAIEAEKHSLQKEFLKFEGIVEDCDSMVREGVGRKGIIYTSDVQNDMPMINADRRALKQVMLNLLSNATKFTPEGGEVMLTAKASKDTLKIEVRDTGPGISRERLATLTDPFVRGETDPHKSQEGTGLGLAIVKSLVNLHDGDLMIKSEVGVGTTVTVTLPLGGA